MGFFSKKIKKQCEVCYKDILSPYETCVLEQTYLVFTNNRDVESVDYDNYVVRLLDGGTIPFTLQVDKDTVCETGQHMIYRFCSEDCEDQLLESKQMITRQDIHEKHLYMKPPKDIHILCSLPINRIPTVNLKCEICNETYKEFQPPEGTSLKDGMRRRWISFPITKFKTFEGSYKLDSTMIGEIQRDYGLMLSGLSENKKTYGTWYCYEFDTKDAKNHNICSTSCGFELSIKFNKVVLTNSLIDHNRMGNIVPSTKEINNDLENKLISRPSYLS
ncbi:hypothetical protein N9C34_01485 [Candidatus Marinimicrobia bacterium]|nr:hypothetical protein [Candidatus Neomarinimicrobiota bacterium]